MTEPRRFRLIDVSTLLLVLAVAAGARGWYLLECADSGRAPGPLRVQDRPPPTDPLTALRLVGAGIGGPLPLTGALAPTGPAAPAEGEFSTHVAPGYPWLLSLARQAPEPDRTVRWAQVALGALTAGLYFLFARRAFDNLLVAALAGLFCALHPFWVVAAGELADGVTAAFLLGLALWLGARSGQSGGALTSLLYGLSLAGLALVRAALLPFAFVAVLWFLWRCRSLSRGWLYALLAFLGFANALVPWTVRNYRATGGDIVPIVDTAWLRLWEGNNPDATGGAQDPAVLVRRLSSHDEAAEPGYAWLAPEVRDEVGRNPAGTVNRRLWAGLSFVFGEQWLRQRTAWQTVDSAGEMPSWLAESYPAILVGTLLGMLLLAFAGWRWTYGWRRPAMPAALAVVWLPLPYLLGHADALAGPRLPLDGVLLSFAAFTLVALLPRIGTRLRSGAPAEGSAEAAEKADLRELNP